jgi:thiol-disulfide isomerase/thioredoxin
MTSARTTTLRAILVTLALTVLALAHAQSDGPAFGVRAGQAAPDFTMLNTAGEPVTLSDLRGAPVVLNFWASWCPPCIAEMPLLDRAAQSLAGDAVFLLVNVGENADTVASFLNRVAVENATVVRDAAGTAPQGIEGLVPSQAVASVYQTYGLPTTLFVDENGVIQRRIEGPVYDSTLAQHLTTVGIDWDPASAR